MLVGLDEQGVIRRAIEVDILRDRLTLLKSKYDPIMIEVGELKPETILGLTLEDADDLRLSRSWVQYPQTYREHFDISRKKRIRAVQSGAVEITKRELVERMWRKK